MKFLDCSLVEFRRDSPEKILVTKIVSCIIFPRYMWK